MPATRDTLLEFLCDLGIEVETYDHPPIFTVEQGKHLKEQWPGGHSKNLFLKDKKGALLLISAKDDTTIDLKALPKALGCGRLSFGNAQLMEEVLGVTPGSVTGLALINDPGPNPKTRFLLDKRLTEVSPIHFHPLINDATTAITPQDFLRFVTACGHEAEVVDFSSV